jgi:TonB-dependent SusC/RagA subfamily outer membrane receptor
MLTLVAVLVLPLVEFPFYVGKEFISDGDQINVVVLASMVEGQVVSSPLGFQWQYGVLLLFVVGCIVYIVRLLIQLVSLYLFAQRTMERQMEGRKFNISNQLIGPFSFFSFICVNPNLYTEQELNEVLAHERVHVNQLHSVDIMLLELFRCVFWINPFMHILRKEARQNLEYLADRQVVKMGYSSVHYQYTLLKVADSKILPVIVSEFRMSNLKKRIVMMNKSKASRLSLLRYSLAIPLLGLLWFFAAPASAQEPDKAKGDTKKEVLTMPENALYIVGGEERSYAEIVGKVTPEDIESISILKGKAGEELYGEKGKNGVVLIKIKKIANKTSEDTAEKAVSFDVKELGLKGTLSAITVTKGIERWDGNDTPLFVVDGVELSADEVQKILVENIKSISVLKGGKAEEQYGEKGKNGVVLITTK